MPDDNFGNGYRTLAQVAYDEAHRKAVCDYNLSTAEIYGEYDSAIYAAKKVFDEATGLAWNALEDAHEAARRKYDAGVDAHLRIMTAACAAARQVLDTAEHLDRPRD